MTEEQKKYFGPILQTCMDTDFIFDFSHQELSEDWEIILDILKLRELAFKYMEIEDKKQSKVQKIKDQLIIDFIF